MHTVTKRRRATKRPAEPPAIPPANLEPRGIEIYPELMELDAVTTEGQFRPDDPKTRSMDICEHDGSSDGGRRLFTVTINPLLNAASADKIIKLIVNVPELWRLVRRDYALKLGQPDPLAQDFADFAAAQLLLYEAAGERQPYDAAENDGDETIYCHGMERDRQLADPSWRKAMVSKFIRIENRGNAKEFGVAFYCNVIPACTFCTLIPSDMAAHLRDKHGVQIDTPAQENRP
jgi:hypothetical protein